MNKKKIALIEDERVLSDVLKEELIASGFDVVCAYDGREGFEAVKREKPDLILLDIIMPKLDGIALLKKLKEDESVKDIPVVMLTVFGSREKIADTVELGAKSYLIKDEQTTESIVKAAKHILGDD